MGEACSIVLRGATEQIIGEAERSLHDALCVLTSTVKETKTTFGGGNLSICIFMIYCISTKCNRRELISIIFSLLGCSEMLMANAVAEEAAVTAGKEARAMESFANALRNMPAIIAENGGYDSAQLVSELKALHKQGNKLAGLGN